MPELVDLTNADKMVDAINLLPTGLSKGNPLNIGQSQARARYWRTLENGDWAETAPLPADALSIIHYFGKGFRGSKPESKARK